MRTARAALCVFVLLLVSNADAQTHYAIKDIGGLGEPGVFANAINSTGQIAGWCYTLPYNYPHAFLYSGGAMKDLGVLGGVANLSDSEANGINDSGQVVGWSWDANGKTRAFLYSGNSIQDLGTLGGETAWANAINNNGQIVGNSALTTGDSPPSHAFLYSGGTMLDLGTLGGNGSNAAAISQNGRIAGTSNYSATSYNSHAFLYSGGTMHDLGTLGGTYSWASGVNDNGQVAGSSYFDASNRQHAFLYSDGSMRDVGPAGSSQSDAYGINAGGQVVGNYYASWITDGSTYGHAFISSGGTTTDMNSLINPAMGLVLEIGAAINDQGWIVGRAHYASDRYRYPVGFLAKPASPGDVTLDGMVDIIDLNRLLTNYNKTGAAWTDGDLTGDGTVDADDLTRVLTGYNQTVWSSAGPAATAVPEPSSILLAAILLLLVGVHASACLQCRLPPQRTR